MMNLAYQPCNTQITAQQPWVNTKFSLNDSDVEVRSADGFIFQLHRVVLDVSSGAFPGSEIETGGEMVQLTEPAKVLGILFALMYPKRHRDPEREGFAVLAAVAEAAEKYEVFSATEICNVRMEKFLPQHATEILVHAVKHDYPSLINATLPHFATAPLIEVLEKLPPSYMVPWVRYREAWRSVFKESVQFVMNLNLGTGSCHHSSSFISTTAICTTCRQSLSAFVLKLEEIDTVSALHDTLHSPGTSHLKSALKCCRDEKPVCPFIDNLTKLCREKIQKIPTFATFLGLQTNVSHHNI